jgi:hypothetical protein
LELAKQVTVAELCPVLAEAASQAAKLILSVEKQQEQEPASDLIKDQVYAMHDGTTLLRLALAVAATCGQVAY